MLRVAGYIKWFLFKIFVMETKNTKLPVVIICGPTGIGKTSAAVKAAEKFNGEIISADSMQIYRQMEIGTAKPTRKEQDRIPHHMIDIVDPDEPFDAARYLEMGRKIIFELHHQKCISFVAGGTGLYIKALIHGLFRAESPDVKTRQQLKEEAATHGSTALHNRLYQIDPEAAQRIHPNDTFRIIRALEMYAATGRTLTEYHRAHEFRDSPFRVLKIGLSMERQALYDRIDRRVNAMMAAGFEDEVKGLLEKGYSDDLKSMQSLGYRHMADYLSGRLSKEEAVRTMKRDTRRYAKRQLTWFRADPEIIWTEPPDVPSLYPKIAAFLEKIN